jgi:tetratricopeptide (TPR) repeat protein
MMRRLHTALMIAVISGLFIGALPAFAATDFERGTELYSKGQLSAAADAFIDSICAQPKAYPSHYALANTYMKMGKMAEAQTEYEMCLENYPDKFTKSNCHKALKYLTGKKTGSAAVADHSAESLSIMLSSEGDRRAAAAQVAIESQRSALAARAARSAEKVKENTKAQIESLKENAPWWCIDVAAGKMVPVIPLGLEDELNERAVKVGEHIKDCAKQKAATLKPSLGTTEVTDGLRSQINASGHSSVRLSPVGTNVYVRNYESNQVAGKSTTGVK